MFLTVPADTGAAWAGAWLFGFQIYFDFSGYTDIALGAAMLLGLRLPTNFRTPYLAADPREFWHRWHITLSTWIRDYLYIPLGGNREGGPIRQWLVLIAVMALAGLWHGANWTFVAWGVLWGVYILVWRTGATMFERLPVVARWSLHISVVMILWVFFRSPDIAFALSYIGSMFSFEFPHTSIETFAWGASGFALLMALHWAESLAQTRRTMFAMRRMTHPALAGTMAGLCVLLLLFPSYAINPFIYFRF
jgi:alginate O-acetyltransferase complex protein AlgI